jgi:folate-binding protein YgfZ
MKPEWQQFLLDNGAEFSAENKLVSFGNPARERRIPPQGNIICDLNHIGLIRVHGADAATFLQNQLTNDINEVTEQKSQLTAYCNHKGRAIANFRVIKRGDEFYLRLSHDLIDTVLKKLRMYVLMSKVVLEDASTQLVHFGFSGPEADRILANRTNKTFGTGDTPESINEIIRHDSLSIIRLPGIVPRYEVLGDPKEAMALWKALDVDAAPVSHQSWQYLNILAGIPVITEASSEAWVPQMLNFDRINGISFNKGCFPGQEVVARLNYLGETKRRTYRLLADTDQLPNIGDKIMSGDTEAGTVVNAVINPDDQVEMLAVLKNAVINEDLTLENNKVSLLDLPYKLTTDEN